MHEDPLLRLAHGEKLHLQCVVELLGEVDHNVDVALVLLGDFPPNSRDILGDGTSAAAPVDRQLKFGIFLVAESFRLLRGNQCHKKSEQNSYLHLI